MKLTRRQNDLLEELRIHGRWVRPMDIGGNNGSHHSATLRQLWRKGLIQRLPRNTLHNVINPTTPKKAFSFIYRIGGANETMD
ncbi:MAG: hypothetical protein JKX85_01280 [Phycisphaeraceae bacterium]|nr:hypothetical protein [Phycisphaeraceae bacterium]